MPLKHCSTVLQWISEYCALEIDLTFSCILKIASTLHDSHSFLLILSVAPHNVFHMSLWFPIFYQLCLFYMDTFRIVGTRFEWQLHSSSLKEQWHQLWLCSSWRHLGTPEHLRQDIHQTPTLTSVSLGSLPVVPFPKISTRKSDLKLFKPFALVQHDDNNNIYILG